MTLRFSMDDQCSQKSYLSASASFLFLASLFLVLASVCPPFAQAADEPAIQESISTSDLARRCDSTDWFGDLNTMQGRRRDLLPNIQSINMPTSEVRSFNENEFLPASATANTANTPSAIFKTERWRTNKAVIASSIFAAAWLTADGITTAGMSRGASEAGSAWAYGKHPTPGRTAAMMAAEFVGVEASSYVLHKMKAPKWVYIAPMLVSGSLHASGAIPNWKNGQ